MMGDQTTYTYVCLGHHGAASAEGVTPAGVYGSKHPTRSSLSGCGGLEDFFAGYGRRVEDGSPVVDLTRVEDMSAGLAFRAPMVDPTKTDDEVDRWQGAGLDEVGSMVAGIAGSWFGPAGVAAALSTTTGEPGPFDHVSPWQGARWWAQYGARVGTVERGTGADLLPRHLRPGVDGERPLSIVTWADGEREAFYWHQGDDRRVEVDGCRCWNCARLRRHARGLSYADEGADR